ncbi:hypothetical protein GCM10023320_58440 [Pseudonocardia adelaidensis]|uniref:Uncharacterized protein n=1 Tax=Pseudonocardia adelaidensis TaxID=648754 RepID=A0ABP9NTK3_9PSEU
MPERLPLGEVTATHGIEQQRQRVGADEVGGDDLVPRTDRDVVRDHVQKVGASIT